MSIIHLRESDELNGYKLIILEKRIIYHICMFLFEPNIEDILPKKDCIFPIGI